MNRKSNVNRDKSLSNREKNRETRPVKIRNIGVDYNDCSDHSDLSETNRVLEMSEALDDFPGVDAPIPSHNSLYGSSSQQRQQPSNKTKKTSKNGKYNSSSRYNQPLSGGSDHSVSARSHYSTNTTATGNSGKSSRFASTVHRYSLGMIGRSNSMTSVMTSITKKHDRGNKGYLDEVETTVRGASKADGTYDVECIFKIVEKLERTKRHRFYMKRTFFIGLGLSFLLLLTTTVLMYFVIDAAKAISPDNSSNLVDAKSKKVVSTHARGVKLALSQIDFSSAVNNNINGRALEQHQSSDNNNDSSYDDHVGSSRFSRELQKFECASSGSKKLIGTVPVQSFNTQWDEITDGSKTNFAFQISEFVELNFAVIGHDLQKTELANGVVRYTGLIDNSNSGSSSSSNSRNNPTMYYHLYCNEECHVFQTNAPTIVVSSVTTDSASFAFRTDFPSSNVRVIAEEERYNGGSNNNNNGIIRYSSNPSTTALNAGAVMITSSTSDCTGYVTVNGLKPDTQYYYNVYIDDVEIKPDYIQTYRTYPRRKSKSNDIGATIAFSFVVLSDSTNSKDYNKVPTYKNAGKEDALFALQIGDFDHSEPVTLEEYRSMHRNLRDPNYEQGKLLTRYILSKMSFWHIWNDHDYCGAGNSYQCSKTRKKNASRAFREYYPNYPYGSAAATAAEDGGDGNVDVGNYYNFAVGNAEIIVLDTQSQRKKSSNTIYTNGDNNDVDTMLGEKQISWLFNILLSTDSELIFLVSSVNGNVGSSSSSSSWSSHIDEANEIKSFLANMNMLNGKVIMISGDTHIGGGAIDNGCNNLLGIPEINVAPTNIRGGGGIRSNNNQQWSEGVGGGTQSSSIRSSSLLLALDDDDPGYVLIVVENKRVMLVNKKYDGSEVRRFSIDLNMNNYQQSIDCSIDTVRR